MRYYYSSIRMAKIKTVTPQNDDKDVEQQAFSFITGGNAK